MGDVMRDFKRHTARQLVRQWSAEEKTGILMKLEQSVTEEGQTYKIWEDGYDARDVYSVDFLHQKMEYIHRNPCQPKWKLANAPEDYLWSSAGFYLAGKPVIIPVDDVRELLV